MAEVTAFRNNALPYPVYGVPYTVVFPLLDADGDPVTGATCDSEISKNGDTGVDCTNEGTEISFTTATNKGIYYLTLTAVEMTADIVAVTIYSATSKATPIVLYPRKLVPIIAGTSGGTGLGTGVIRLQGNQGTALDDKWNGCLCVATIDGNVEARIIDDYTGSSKDAAVTPDWNVEPDADDTYIIYLPEGMQVPTPDVLAISNDATAADNLESACENYSVTRGLTGTALPAIVAGAASGVPLKDASNFLDIANMPAIAAGAAGGLFIAGGNAATSITTALTANIVGNITGNITGSLSGSVGSVTTKTGYALANTGADLILKTSTFALAIADAVWDEILTGATHNTATSAGRRLREVGASVITAGTAQAGGASTITLAATESATDDIHNLQMIALVGGTGVGQCAHIHDYAGGTKVATVSSPWEVQPDATSEYVLLASARVHVGHVDDDAITAASINTGAFSADAFAADALVAATFAASSLDGKGDWNTVTPDAAGVAPTAGEIKTAIEAGGSSLAQIKAVTDVLPDAGALTAIAADTARLTAVRAAVLTDWIDGGRLDVIQDAIKVITDALTAAAATKLALSAAGIVAGAAEAGTLSTTQMTTNLTEATDDHYIGAVIVWTSGPLAGQRTDITDYAGANGLLTFTAVTEAPEDGNTFVIL